MVSWRNESSSVMNKSSVKPARNGSHFRSAWVVTTRTETAAPVKNKDDKKRYLAAQRRTPLKNSKADTCRVGSSDLLQNATTSKLKSNKKPPLCSSKPASEKFNMANGNMQTIGQSAFRSARIGTTKRERFGLANTKHDMRKSVASNCKILSKETIGLINNRHDKKKPLINNFRDSKIEIRNARTLSQKLTTSKVKTPRQPPRSISKLTREIARPNLTTGLLRNDTKMRNVCKSPSRSDQLKMNRKYEKKISLASNSKILSNKSKVEIRISGSEKSTTCMVNSSKKLPSGSSKLTKDSSLLRNDARMSKACKSYFRSACLGTAGLNDNMYDKKRSLPKNNRILPVGSMVEIRRGSENLRISKLKPSKKSEVNSLKLPRETVREAQPREVKVEGFIGKRRLVHSCISLLSLLSMTELTELLLACKREIANRVQKKNSWFEATNHRLQKLRDCFKNLQTVIPRKRSQASTERYLCVVNKHCATTKSSNRALMEYG